ncbi:MAG: histone deacetylase [Deltaproteobacteria bacterium]|nr:histone deacetylase [Deltaproteobacteria bacterium]
MRNTGIFFHPLMSEGDWPIIGNKFRGFPQALGDVLELPNVTLYTSEPVQEELLLKVHTPSLLSRVKDAWYYQGALRAVGGCVAAAQGIAEGRLKNALVFSVAAGHHASPSSAWGGTYLSCTGPTVVHLRERYGWKRVAIIDTDCHHGDGTRAVFEKDKDVLHVCFCDIDWVSEDGTKFDVDVGWRTSDQEYLQRVKEEFEPRVREFHPQLIFHNFGHDTCQGDYGDRGLTPDFFPVLAKMIKDVADQICGGGYIVITHGGARADVAKRIFPEIARILAS